MRTANEAVQSVISGSGDSHALGLASALAWMAGPPGFPPGAKYAILSGDPRNGPFVVRFRAPAGYRIPPHTHPDDEHVTVLAGSFHIAMGDHLDESHAQTVKAGGYWSVPMNTPHVVWFSEDSLTQVHGSGPVGIAYLDPADDPRNPRPLTPDSGLD